MEAQPETIERRIREETLIVSGTPITFYRDNIRRQWVLRTHADAVQLPVTEAVRVDSVASIAQDTN